MNLLAYAVPTEALPHLHVTTPWASVKNLRPTSIELREFDNRDGGTERLLRARLDDGDDLVWLATADPDALVDGPVVPALGWGWWV